MEIDLEFSNQNFFRIFQTKVVHCKKESAACPGVRPTTLDFNCDLAQHTHCKSETLRPEAPRTAGLTLGLSRFFFV